MNAQLKILIVEDEIIIASLLKKILEIEGFSIVDIVSSGEKAIKITREQEIDLILMDIHITGIIDGIETSRLISENGDAKIIFITGYPDMETREKAGKINPLGFFIKPLNIEELVIFIKKKFELTCEE
jgi:DNA-binding NtrC family response regulator